jgi:LPXTG-motif cell wall-anchored protein
MAVADHKITRSDIEGKLREIKGEVESTGEAAKPIALAVGIAGVVALAGLAYLLGKRKGKKKTTIVEVRRV